MTRPSIHATLAVAAALVLVGAAAATVALPTGVAATGQDLAFDRPVPDEYDFERPGEANATTGGTATVDGQEYGTLSVALSAADAGDTVRLRGRFDPHGPVEVETPDLTLRSAGGSNPVIDGTGEGDVLVVNASGVTVEGLWVRNAGWAADENDAAVWVDAPGVTVRDSRVTNTTFGVWVDGVRDARIVNNTIVGRDSVARRTDRGNGIQLWDATDGLVAGNRITDARDGIYYSWATDVVARNNTLWDLRYGVHYMYSDRCTLANNTAFGNDVGYALMVSEDLTIRNNVAVNNTGESGHGILVKSIDHTAIRGNHVVGNGNGLFVYNSLDNELAGNLVLDNDVGVHLSAGSVRERVHGNTFARNERTVIADVGGQVTWNESVGNYWAEARVRDLDGDGVGRSAYRPTDVVDQLTTGHPRTRLFAASPAFEVMRRAERTLPVVESGGVVDRRPLAESPHDWRRYYDRD